MNLHDWIDELCDVLDIDADVDEGLILDLAKTVATNVERPAAPVSAYLLGVAVGRTDASGADTERLAALAQELAERWDRPTGASEGADGDDGDRAAEVPVPPDLDLDFGEDDTAPD
ncbi:DUF6457 domain-containing protein [Nocardioides sp. BP30]|uniref:DUF6457 domain-containing protein n=1 Tax=Nocardioides sp. BP30 TaxID=3036374 RepID=UPI002468852A|nr:DUF6457 domain-containing protein [Nocardioides sp. BP30]WGL52429.1 DUF6457 domain-containing protein [Nocardioides sp. BP30]